MVYISYRNGSTIKRNLIKTYKEYLGHINNSSFDKNKENGDFIWGIDISHHQRSVDWKVLIEKNKPDFIFLKATEGSTHIDTKYSDHLKKSRQHSIPVGAYHFFSYQSSGKSQAQNFIRNAKLIKGDIYPVLDVEFTKGMKDKSWMIREIQLYCDEIKKEYGVHPIIYCEYDYYIKYLDKDFKDFAYWISDLYQEPKHDYLFWQYTISGLVHGIGRIDNNKLNKKKNLNNFLLTKDYPK